MADEHLDDNDTFESAPAVAESPEVPPQYGVGPFSIREVALIGVWLVAFVVSFFSLNPVRFDSVWTSGLTWILTIGVPTVAVFLIILRRLSPDGIRRVGSLGIDQFASVAFSVSTTVWITYIWETVAFAIDQDVWVRSWVMWVEAVLMLAGVFLTVLAPFLPVLRDDFQHRPEIIAHRNARPLRPITTRPAPAPRPAPEAAQAPQHAAALYGGEPTHDYTTPYASPYAAEPVDTSWAPQHEPEPVRHQAFWALAPDERDVVDEAGAPVWRIGPTAWALVIEDRGDTFVMRHEDGRIGYLHNTSGVTRG